MNGLVEGGKKGQSETENTVTINIQLKQKGVTIKFIYNFCHFFTFNDLSPMVKIGKWV